MEINSRDLKLLQNTYSASDGPSSLNAALKRYKAGEPLAYLLGEQPFWRYTFKVSPDVLIPRPDTERVVETALAHLPEGGRFADLCTGSGCIAISIAGERQDVTGVMADLSPAALKIAEENAIRIGVQNRIGLVCADLLSENPLTGLFDLIVSNPPYIPANDIALYPTLRYEPRMALDGGEDGLLFYKAFIARFSGLLKPKGVFVFEIGYDQRAAILSLAAEAGFCCAVTKDYGGNDRVALLTRLSEMSKGEAL